MQTIDQVKDAIDNGKDVRWSNDGYKCIKDSLGKYLVVFTANGYCSGIANESPDKFYIKR